ncbi:MAG: HPF/RaiA family ribosome-associated protein [Myxococcales bacterium]|nr:HPF/RaiA family ribosome-associated protein [Myxococcales bacterium]
MSSSSSVEASIRRWVARLEHNYDRIQRCSVIVEHPHNHHRHGNAFHIRIDLTVPGREIAVSRDPERDPGHEDVYVALADAFRAARRQLQDHARIQRGDTKSHVA